MIKELPLLVLVACASLAPGLAAAGPTDMNKGSGGSEVQGSAGPGGSQGTNGLESCDKPMGAMAVVEPQYEVMSSLSSHNLQSPTGIIRMMIQQSNCFIVVERGTGMRNMKQERELAESGDLREGSNMGGGQMVGADFVLTPAMVFSDNDAGGMNGAIAGAGKLFGSKNSWVGGVAAGGVKFKEAQTSMLVSDARTGVQVAAAEGSARKADLKLGGATFLGLFGAFGAYGSTAEGKMIASSLLDNYNNVVRSVRGQPSLHRDVGTLAEEAAKKTKAGAVFNEGDVVRPKIANIKLFAQAADGTTVATLSRDDELIYMGVEENGYISVESGAGSGWVKKVLVAK